MFASFLPSIFVVHYTPGLLNSLFGSARELDGNVSLQFQGHASLFNERCTPDRNVLIRTGDQRMMKSILNTALLEDRDRKIYRKPNFMFGNAAPDTNQQLLAREGQWIFTLNSEKYYLPSSKNHFSLSFF